ncbi:uncharacterized protein LOC131655905 [Vicia villosa]|uniref:uncharacterized protein LOC131655905 n=1 Tax=Vicia villosa TaxID=3911 RepID=UPI00273C3A1F|nr:uncharacterized protein LOC131655905 [Vicia villosa]
MLSCFCFFLFKTTFLWMASPFVFLMLFSTYIVVGFSFLSLFFSSLALILSTILLYIWKHKTISLDENVSTSNGRENLAATTPMLMNESTIEAMEKKEEEKEEGDSDSGVVDNYDSYSNLDGSISDEESLIEISLPSGHLMDKHKQEFNQQRLMELLAEFNEMFEEENLIEIDISMGSIKCSRFEIAT